MARNKVEIVNGSTTTVFLDVSGTTATPETVLTGYTFTQADGTQATGTMEQSSGGGIQEVATDAEMSGLLSTATVGTIVLYTGTTGTYTNNAYYLVEEASVLLTVINDFTNYSYGSEISINNGQSLYDYEGVMPVSVGSTVDVSCSGTSGNCRIEVNGVEVASSYDYASYTFTITANTTINVYVN